MLRILARHYLPTNFYLLAFFTSTIHADNFTSTAERDLIAQFQPLTEKYATQPQILEALNQATLRPQTLATILQRDARWPSDTALQGEILQHALSQKFKARVDDAKNNVREILLIDSNGALIASYPQSTDYFQGDEEKFIRSAIDKQPFHGVADWDDSSGSIEIHISVPILDAQNNVLGILVEGIEVNLRIITRLKPNK